MREQILKELEEVIFLTIDRCKALQYHSKAEVYANPHKLRQGYLNSLSSLIKSYNQLLKDKEIDEIKDELEELKEELVR